MVLLIQRINTYSRISLEHYIFGHYFNDNTTMLLMEPFFWHGLTQIPAWVSNYKKIKVRDEITYPFPNFKDGMGMEKQSHTSLAVWLLMHAVIKVNPCQWQRPLMRNLISLKRCQWCGRSAQYSPLYHTLGIISWSGKWLLIYWLTHW